MTKSKIVFADKGRSIDHRTYEKMPSIETADSPPTCLSVAFLALEIAQT